MHALKKIVHVFSANRAKYSQNIKLLGVFQTLAYPLSTILAQNELVHAT